MPGPFIHELRVRYGECDPQGIVFNANYLMYFDVAFTELWRAGVGPWLEMVDWGVDAVVANANIDFRSPARFDDMLQLSSQVTRLGQSSITTGIDILRDGELLVAGRLRHVCVSAPLDLDSKATSTPWPDWVREGLEPFVVPEDL